MGKPSRVKQTAGSPFAFAKRKQSRGDPRITPLPKSTTVGDEDGAPSGKCPNAGPRSDQALQHWSARDESGTRKSDPGRGVCPVLVCSSSLAAWQRFLGHASKLLAHPNASTQHWSFPDPCADQARPPRTKILAAPPGMPGPGPALMPGGLDASASLCTSRQRPGGGGSTRNKRNDVGFNLILFFLLLLPPLSPISIVEIYWISTNHGRTCVQRRRGKKQVKMARVWPGTGCKSPTGNLQVGRTARKTRRKARAATIGCRAPRDND
ncbi:hypothetical protein PG996_003187 [Apiospora saccharicola]|uniref:Uncharacterized protein n=1 Tax=Apiospora saccharicola TaxID=335842 RepID=A0ABR1W1S9_9PEZI